MSGGVPVVDVGCCGSTRSKDVAMASMTERLKEHQETERDFLKETIKKLEKERDDARQETKEERKKYLEMLEKCQEEVKEELSKALEAQNEEKGKENNIVDRIFTGARGIFKTYTGY